MTSKNIPRRRIALLSAAVLTLAFAAPSAWAQAKITRLVVAFPPGGPVDFVARTIGEQLGKELGSQVIIENRAGANGAIAAEYVARATPDGSTLWLTSVGAVAINPPLYEKLPYDPVRDLAPVSLVANNVGGSAAGGPVEMAEETWDAQLDHNLKSVFLTCKHVLPLMEAQAAGAIVNIASTSGLRWTGSAQVAYASTKAGVIQFSRVVAVQYAKAGVRVNTVVPGQLYTPMVDVRLAKQRTGGDVTALLQQRQSRIPLPFMGDGRDTANAALFLASDEARFITGTEIVVDGGMSVRCD